MQAFDIAHRICQNVAVHNFPKNLTTAKIRIGIPALVFILTSHSLLSRPSESYTASEIKAIASESGDSEALPALHGVLAPVAKEYLSLVRRGEYTAAASMEKNSEQSVMSISDRLKGMNEMSAMSSWMGTAGWPFVDPEGNPGFVYQIKADYQYSHYFMLIAVVLEGENVYVKGGLDADSKWPEETKTASIGNISDYALGSLD